MSDDLPQIDYPGLVANALLGVVQDVLAEVAANGLPGAHHFFLTFATEAPGVEMPDSLRRAFPREMTVILQHRFRDLRVDEDGFAVTLEFGGSPEHLRVPWTALSAFVDPSAEMGFRFGPAAGGPIAAGAGPSKPDAPGGNVIRLDRFRRAPKPEGKK